MRLYAHNKSCAKLLFFFDICKFSFKKNKQFEDFLFGSLKDIRSVREVAALVRAVSHQPSAVRS